MTKCLTISSGYHSPVKLEVKRVVFSVPSTLAPLSSDPPNCLFSLNTQQRHLPLFLPLGLFFSRSFYWQFKRKKRSQFHCFSSRISHPRQLYSARSFSQAWAMGSLMMVTSALSALSASIQVCLLSFPGLYGTLQTL